MAGSMVTVPHTVEDFSDTGSLSPGIQRSPVKLLNTLTASQSKPGTNKRRLDETDEEEVGAPESKAPCLDYEVEKENQAVFPEANKISSAIDKMYQVPAMNGHRDFPCIWLGDTSPTRNPEGGDRSPNPPSQPSPRESQEAPSSISPPTLTSSMSSVGMTTPLKLSVEPSLSFNTPSPITNGLINHPPPPLLERESSLDSMEGENMPVEVCPECHKVFKRKVYLQRHMEREHWSTAKVFKCEDCSYETKHQSNLSVHRRTHTGERPYHCGACGQRYTQGHLLKSHIRSRHGGNMEFYNLDKKSESTRGRKSLDMKHESANHHGLTKVDKISTLLQVAAANQALRPPQQNQQGVKFANLLAPPMGAMPPFFGTMRAMMPGPGPLGLPGGLMTAPRFFPLGGMPGNGLQFNPQGGLMPTMQQSLQMLANQNASLETARQNVAEALRAQQKLAELDTSPSSYFSRHTPSPTAQPQAVPQPQAQHSAGNQPASRQEEAATMPQDLSTTKKVVERVEPQDLSSGGATHLKYDREPGELISEMDAEEAEDLVMQNPPSLSQSDSSQEDYLLHKQTSPELKKATALLALNLKQCPGGNCLYARQLRDLRKNVLRMLSVFTPDLGVENGIDYETDTVDQLLHEVIYSNVDEQPLGKE